MAIGKKNNSFLNCDYTNYNDLQEEYKKKKTKIIEDGYIKTNKKYSVGYKSVVYEKDLSFWEIFSLKVSNFFLSLLSCFEDCQESLNKGEDALLQKHVITIRKSLRPDKITLSPTIQNLSSPAVEKSVEEPKIPAQPLFLSVYETIVRLNLELVNAFNKYKIELKDTSDLHNIKVEIFQSRLLSAFHSSRDELYPHNYSLCNLAQEIELKILNEGLSLSIDVLRSLLSLLLFIDSILPINSSNFLLRLIKCAACNSEMLSRAFLIEKWEMFFPNSRLLDPDEFGIYQAIEVIQQIHPNVKEMDEEEKNTFFTQVKYVVDANLYSDITIYINLQFIQAFISLSQEGRTEILSIIATLLPNLGISNFSELNKKLKKVEKRRDLISKPDKWELLPIVFQFNFNRAKFVPQCTFLVQHYNSIMGKEDLLKCVDKACSLQRIIFENEVETSNHTSILPLTVEFGLLNAPMREFTCRFFPLFPSNGTSRNLTENVQKHARRIELIYKEIWLFFCQNFYPKEIAQQAILKYLLDPEFWSEFTFCGNDQTTGKPNKDFQKFDLRHSR